MRKRTDSESVSESVPESDAERITDAAGDLLSELAGQPDARVLVWRVLESGETEYCCAVDAGATDLSGLLDRLALDHGGGTFRLRGKRGSRWHGATTVRVARRATAPAAV